MLSFFDSAEIGADRDLKYILESELAESRLHSRICELFAELARDRRRYYGVNRRTGLHGIYGLIYLTFVYYGCERAAVETHAARHALFLIYHSVTVVILSDRAEAARGYTRSLLPDYGIVLAGLHAHSALDAFFRVDHVASQIPVI